MKIGNTDINDYKVGATDLNEIRIGNDLIWQRSSSALDPDYVLLRNYAGEQGGTLPSAPIEVEENQFYLDVKAESGLWSQIDWFAIHGTDGNEAYAKAIAKVLTSYTEVLTPTFQGLDGWKGNGIDNYLNSGRAPSGESIYAQDSAHAVIFVDTNGSVGSISAEGNAGCEDGGSKDIRINVNATAYSDAINGVASNSGGVSGLNGDVILLVRNNATDIVKYDTNNPTGLTLTSATAPPPTTQFHILNNRSTRFSDSNITFSGIGGGLTQSQAVAYRQAILNKNGLLSAQQVDQTLINAVGQVGGTIDLTGNDPRTTVSDAAVSQLTTDGVTVLTT